MDDENLISRGKSLAILAALLSVTVVTVISFKAAQPLLSITN